ncbi:DUF4180 domain-containing protein [Algoriphagus sp. AGSA1]|uniref:DUF4180 domain-containing protein n=1 Tax=Algoriphagus sp. AGSA1 TaxID=2907213 RepID=UPI001F2867AD|nr:DUF4180 domain-containing protein [Algoriphagus sp. AGSA1]MCE7054984.1 DUF4180 domain-containing protein [Algoriphagus sp. AGSA1]
MKIETHLIDNFKIAEVTSAVPIFRGIEEGLDLLGNLYYQGFDKAVIHEKNIAPDFFDLKTGIAGEILQKFAQYKMPLVIVGDFTKYESESLKAFIFESNKGNQINFLTSTDDVLQ